MGREEQGASRHLPDRFFDFEEPLDDFLGFFLQPLRYSSIPRRRWMCPGRDNWRGTGQLPDERALEEELEESQVADPEETEHSSTESQVPATAP